MVRNEIDQVWSTFKDVIKGYIPSRQEVIDEKWREMAKTSSQKRLLLQKQNALRNVGGLL